MMISGNNGWNSRIDFELNKSAKLEKEINE
jgi:hypothetical protein